MALSRISRYQSLPDVVDRDAGGRTIVRKALRELPAATGTFKHTVADGDRLDHLASAYYQQPRKWWRICDANPQLLSPLDLVGRGPLRTLRVPLRASGPPLATLAAALRADPGVQRLRFDPEPLAVAITYNRNATSERTLLDGVRSAGFAAGEPAEIGRMGKHITIPPDAP